MNQMNDDNAHEANELQQATSAAEELLKRRTALLAAEVIDDEDSDLSNYLKVRIGESELYGIDYDYLDEVLKSPAITRVPCTPAFIKGVVNRRSELLTVIDLKSIFGTADSSSEDMFEVVVVRGQYAVGIVVDEVIGNERYSPKDLTPALGSAGVKKVGYIQGIYQGKVTMLNIPALLSDTKLQLNSNEG